MNLFLESSRTFMRESFCQRSAKSFLVDIWPDSKYPSDERNKLLSFFNKSYYLRYLLVLYRITTLEKSERLSSLRHDSLPRYAINRTPPLAFSYEYSKIFWTSCFTKQLQTTGCKGFLFA